MKALGKVPYNLLREEVGEHAIDERLRQLPSRLVALPTKIVRVATV
jgi:hypothetical protein